MINNGNSITPIYLLCNSRRIAISHSLSAEKVVKCWKAAGHPFGTATVRPLIEEGMINLYHSLECRLQLFTARLTDGGDSL